jgi:ubiquinone biosynthesis protein
VHTARLKENGREIVIKVIRPDIEPVIEADLRLMQALARLVARFVPQSGRLRPSRWWRSIARPYSTSST